MAVRLAKSSHGRAADKVERRLFKLLGVWTACEYRRMGLFFPACVSGLYRFIARPAGRRRQPPGPRGKDRIVSLLTGSRVLPLGPEPGRASRRTGVYIGLHSTQRLFSSPCRSEVHSGTRSRDDMTGYSYSFSNRFL